VALSSLTDPRGLRAALVGVEAVVHLAGGERGGRGVNLAASEVIGTRNLTEAAVDAGVRRFLFPSHLGVDRSSAYPLMRAKAQAEELVRQSGLRATILRSAAVYGPRDHFATSIAMTLAASPIAYWIPGEGDSLLQPLWIEDLVHALAWSLEEDALVGQTYEIGGPEYLRYVDIVRMVMAATGSRRVLSAVSPPLLRLMLRLGEGILPRPMMTPFWLDYLAVHRTAELSTLPRAFGLQPSRMETRLAFLTHQRWVRELISQQLAARAA
jgi:NADH dehydrogenase